MAKYLVTGVAGFIASRTASMLLEQGHNIVGVDNLNDAYDVRLKHWRLEQIRGHKNLEFHQIDICDRKALESLFAKSGSAQPPFDAVVNLAARAGVRQSVENPWVYVDTNLTGTLNLLEMCRQHGVRSSSLHRRRVCTALTTLGRSGKMPTRTSRSRRTLPQRKRPKRCATRTIICTGPQ